MGDSGLTEGCAVEYVGDQDGDAEVYLGHPGRVVGVHFDEVSVSWVNGPSWEEG